METMETIESLKYLATALIQGNGWTHLTSSLSIISSPPTS